MSFSGLWKQLRKIEITGIFLLSGLAVTFKPSLIVFSVRRPFAGRPHCDVAQRDGETPSQVWSLFSAWRRLHRCPLLLVS